MKAKTVKDGGPAFPSALESVTDESASVVSWSGPQGMSLRDWFAGMALQALVAGAGATIGDDLLAFDAYALADAMINAREPGSQSP